MKFDEAMRHVGNFMKAEQARNNKPEFPNTMLAALCEAAIQMNIKINKLNEEISALKKELHKKK